jgi:cytochrome c peroxidase
MILRSIKYKFICCAILLAVLMSCSKESEMEPFNYLDLIPSHFPIPNIHPDSFPSLEKIVLGRKLFYDIRLSKNNTISCASCHQQSLAFSDSIAFSFGDNKAIGTRNAPSLANVVYQDKLLREGSLPTLEMQVLVPIQEHNEFNSNILDITNKLNEISEYRQLSQKAFGSELTPFAITRSISAFERILISGQSKYDAFINGKSNLSSLELKGKELFFSERTNCRSCHGTFLFTNQTFENNGLYVFYYDNGRERFTLDTSDNGRFKVPSLRNVALTAPYMHDGSISSLEQVMEHYSTGGKSHPNKSQLIKNISLSQDEKAALIAFLHTLTDYNFINNKNFKDE